MKNNELTHYGVLGMKWGVKRGKKTVHEDHRKAHSRKRIREMGNQELKDRNNRLNLEKQYKNLKKETRIGGKAVKTFIRTAGTITAVTAAAKIYKNWGDKIVDKVGDRVIKNIRPF